MRKNDGEELKLLTIRKVDSNNRVAIPKQARRLLDINPDDEVVFKYENNVLSLEKKERERIKDEN